MRLVSYDDGRVGYLAGDQVIPLPARTMRDAIASWSAGTLPVPDREAGIPLRDVRLRVPVADPSKIIAAPVNYRDHQAEMSTDTQVGALGFFLKAPSSLLDPGGTIQLPYHDRRFDQEGELALVIGRTARQVSAQDALSYVFGYTGLLDITMRGGEDRSTRKFAANKQQPSFPFGHGLSFARFSYEDLRVQRPGHEEIRLSFVIVNDSPRPGYEVAQLYLRCPEAAAEPPLQLKGFQRVHLRPGERRTVTFTLTSADLAAWSEAAGWTVHPGRYEVLIGASSADVRLRAFTEVTGGTVS